MYEMAGGVGIAQNSFLGSPGTAPESDVVPGGSKLFWAGKRAFDIVISALGIPIIFAIGVLLYIVNPIWNPGPLLYRQRRMGRGGHVISVWKFRSMVPGNASARGPSDPVEADRITPLGNWIRRTRIDELPQCLNVLVGEMSLIGPRPDTLLHARDFSRQVPGYSDRYVIRPGISGYAQVQMGYAEGYDLTAEKTRLDLDYIQNAGWRNEWDVFWKTIGVMATGFGAR
jgi:lipopolysaccharide/colanic/teichoic acid biosynthesis glycosyltransferase